MKRVLIVTVGSLVVILIGISAYYGGRALQGRQNAGLVPTSGSSGQTIPGTPAEIRGTVKKVEGNVVLVASIQDDPIANMTEDERQEYMRKMQSLSMEERQALRQQQLDNAQTVDVHATIPVGVTILKIVPGQGATGEGETGSLSDIKPGTRVAIWTKDKKTDDAIAIAVRIEAGP